EDALAARLEPYEIIVPTRERTFFRAGLIARLPRLRLIAIGGRWTGQVDLAAAAARGIVVTDTEGSGVNAFEHTVALMMARGCGAWRRKTARRARAGGRRRRSASTCTARRSESSVWDVSAARWLPSADSSACACSRPASR